MKIIKGDIVKVISVSLGVLGKLNPVVKSPADNTLSKVSDYKTRRNL